MLEQKTIHLVNPDGTPGLELKGIGQVEWNDKLGDFGGLTFDFFPFVHEPSREALRLGIKVCLCIDGEWKTDSHFWLSDSAQTIISPTGLPLVQTWQGVSLRYLLSKMPVLPEGDAFVPRTITGNPGQIMDTILGEGQAAGFLTWLEWDFDSVNDSANQPWPVSSERELTLDPGATALTAADFLEFEERLVDTKMRAYRLRMFLPGTGFDDFATPAPGLKQMVLRAGQVIHSGDRKGIARDMATVGIAIGTDGRWEIHEDEDAIAEYEKLARIESSDSLTRQSDIAAVAELLVEQQKRPIAYKSYRLRFDERVKPPKGPYVVDGWNKGDKVIIDDIVGSDQTVRIAGVTTRWGAQGGEPEVIIDADTRLIRKAERTDRRLAALLGKGTGAPAKSHRVPPAAPTGLNLSTDLDVPPGGQTKARVLGQFTIPTTKADGQPLLEPLDRVEVRWRYAGQTRRKTITLAPTDNDFEIENLTASRTGTDINVHVEIYAIDKAGPSAALTGTITTAVHDGTYQAYDSAGASIFRVLGDDWHATKVEGGPAPAVLSDDELDRLIAGPDGLTSWLATGPGVDVDSQQGFRTFGAGGALGVHLRPDGTALFTSDVEILGDTTIDQTLTVLADTTVWGLFTVMAGGAPVLFVDETGATLIGRFQTGPGSIWIEDDLIGLGSSTLGFNILGAVFSDSVVIGNALDVDGSTQTNGLDNIGAASVNGTGTTLGFYGSSGSTKLSVTGAPGAGQTGDTLRLLIARLATLGLITNSLT